MLVMTWTQEAPCPLCGIPVVWNYDAPRSTARSERSFIVMPKRPAGLLNAAVRAVMAPCW